MSGMGGGINVVNGGSNNDRYIMTDEEYYKRYGHPRGAKVANFLRGME